MKNIYRLFTAALVLLGAAACNPSEINNPDNPNQKGKSEITITASIIQTRISYDSSDLGEVKQKWEDGDIVFGFHSGSASVSNRIAFRVNSVNSETGEASLVAVSGADWIETDEESGRVVDLVYTGTGDSYNTSGGIDVDLSQQTLDRVRGCMHAHAALQIDDEGNKTLEFFFQNDCALIEIDGLPGAVEDWGFISSGQQVTSVGISNISIPNLYLEGSYSYNNGSFSFETKNSIKTQVIPLDDTKWSINNQGFINGPNDFQGYPQKILIAAAPTLSEDWDAEFMVDATFPSCEIQELRFYYDSHVLKKGNCYVISPQPVVAKTADNCYFRSVMAAFDHAKVLSTETAYCTAEKNTVTLLREYINGFKEDVAHDTKKSYDPKIIQINYPVTLDLNGCTLSLDCNSNLCEWDSFYSGGFEVESGGTLTIDDSKGSGCVDSGSKINEEGIPIITSSGTGTVNILGGSLCHWESGQAIKSTGGTVNVSGGRVYAWGNSAIHISDSGTEGFISGGLVGNKSDRYECILVQDGAECSISGGTIYSRGGSSTVACRSYGTNVSKLYITWPIENTDDEIPDHEPLIYSCYKEYPASPLTAAYCGPVTGEKENTAQVFIQGGFLLTHSQSDDRGTYFYQDDNTTQSTFENLKISSCGDFYANTSEMNSNGSSNITVELYNTGSDKYKSYFKVTDCSSNAYTPVFLFDYLDKEDFYDEKFPIETELYFFEKL